MNLCMPRLIKRKCASRILMNIFADNMSVRSLEPLMLVHVNTLLATAALVLGLLFAQVRRFVRANIRTLLLFRQIYFTI